MTRVALPIVALEFAASLCSGPARCVVPDQARFAMTTSLAVRAVRPVLTAIENDGDGIDLLDARSSTFELLTDLSDRLLNIAAECLPDFPVPPPPGVFNLAELARAVLPSVDGDPTQAAFRIPMK